MQVEAQECTVHLGLWEDEIYEDQFEADPDCVEQGKVLAPWLAIVCGR